MSPNKTNLRWPGAIVLLGAILLAIATALHPIVVDPLNSNIPIHHIAESRDEWMMDHALMALAIVLWLVGLSECSRLVIPYGTISGLYTASLAMWLIVLSFELGGMPIAVYRLQAHSDLSHKTLIDSLFASSLIAGYMAMIPAWLGVILTAWSSRKTPMMNKWLSTLGTIGGILGLVGIVYTLLFPSVWVLLATNAVPFVWTLLFGWRCLRNTP